VSPVAFRSGVFRREPRELLGVGYHVRRQHGNTHGLGRISCGRFVHDDRYGNGRRPRVICAIQPDRAGSSSASTTLFVPVILKSAGANNSFFTSEMTITNRSSTNATLTFSYTGTTGGGSGTGSASILAGQQLIFPTRSRH